MLTVENILLRKCDEKLRAVSTATLAPTSNSQASSVAETKSRVNLIREGFTVNTLTSVTGVMWITCLCDKIFDYPMKNAAMIITFKALLHKVSTRLRTFARTQLHYNIPFARFYKNLAECSRFLKMQFTHLTLDEENVESVESCNWDINIISRSLEPKISQLYFFKQIHSFSAPCLLTRLIFMAADKARSRRFGEPAKFLPVIFVIGIIATLYGVYTYVCFNPLHPWLTSSHRLTSSDYYKFTHQRISAMRSNSSGVSGKRSFLMLFFSCC